MNFKQVCLNKQLVRNKYIIGIDPGDTEHRAIILSPEGFPLIKPFGFKVNTVGFEKFKQIIQKTIPTINPKDIIIGMETSCNLWQTFIDYFKNIYTIVKVSPMTTYLSRGKKSGNFSKTDNKDSFLIAEAVEHGNFYMFQEEKNPIYQQLRELNIYFNKISNNTSQAKLRLRAKIKLIFPELLNCFKLDSLTCLYLLNNHMTPDDFINIDIKKIAPIIKKLSISQHGEKTLLKIKKLATESIGINTSSNYIAVRTNLSSLLRFYHHCLEETAIIAEQLIGIAKTVYYYPILTSLKGVSEISAAQLIAELGDIFRFKHYKQIEKYAGFNLRISQSGKSAGARHINKLGNGRLGKTIYQCVCHTSRYIPEIKMKYIKRKHKKNIYKKNIIACVPQFLSLVMSLVKNNKLYQLNESKYIELCKLEKQYKFNSKALKYYEPKIKSRYRRPNKANKINLITA